MRDAAQAAMLEREASFRGAFEAPVRGMAQADAETGTLLLVNQRFWRDHRPDGSGAGRRHQPVHPGGSRGGRCQPRRPAAGRRLQHRRQLPAAGRDRSLGPAQRRADPRPGGAAAPPGGGAGATPPSAAPSSARACSTRELGHRARNALTVVQAAVRLTPRHDPAAFAEAVEARVAALARAHSLLATEGWTGADLRALVEGELSPFLTTAAQGRISLSGPPVPLMPEAVQPLAMAIHELSMNSTNTARCPARAAGSACSGRWTRRPRPCSSAGPRPMGRQWCRRPAAASAPAAAGSHRSGPARRQRGSGTGCGPGWSARSISRWRDGRGADDRAGRRPGLTRRQHRAAGLSASFIVPVFPCGCGRGRARRQQHATNTRQRRQRAGPEPAAAIDDRSARRRRPRRDARALPAAGVAGGWAHRRGGSAAALAPPQAWGRAADQLHPAGRSHRHHPPAGRLGVAGGDAGGSRLARLGRHRFGECLGPPGGMRPAAVPGRRGAGRLRPARGAAGTGTDRIPVARGNAGDAADAGGVARAGDRPRAR